MGLEDLFVLMLQFLVLLPAFVCGTHSQLDTTLEGPACAWGKVKRSKVRGSNTTVSTSW